MTEPTPAEVAKARTTLRSFVAAHPFTAMIVALVVGNIVGVVIHL